MPASVYVVRHGHPFRGLFRFSGEGFAEIVARPAVTYLSYSRGVEHASLQSGHG